MNTYFELLFPQSIIFTNTYYNTATNIFQQKTIDFFCDFSPQHYCKIACYCCNSYYNNLAGCLVYACHTIQEVESQKYVYIYLYPNKIYDEEVYMKQQKIKI